MLVSKTSSGQGQTTAQPARNRSRRVGWLVPLLAGLFGALSMNYHAGAAAQIVASTNLSDLSMEQLLDVRVERVSGASRYEQEISRAPASVSVITAEEIQKLGYRSLVDVLQGVRGLNVANDRNYNYIGMRGFGRPGDYNSRILLLVDGHRINDNIYNDPLVGTAGMIDVDLIDRVEIIRGPSSSIYGDSAFLGVINVLTKLGPQMEPGGRFCRSGRIRNLQGAFYRRKDVQRGV